MISRWTNPRGGTGVWCDTRDAAIADAVSFAISKNRSVGAVPMGDATDPGLVNTLWAGLERDGWNIEEAQSDVV